MMTGGFTIVSIACWSLSLTMQQHLPPPTVMAGARFPLGFYADFYTMWQDLRVSATWMTLGAWTTLLVTGRWRKASGSIDRLGLCLGAGWLLLGIVQGVIFVIAWF